MPVPAESPAWIEAVTWGGIVLCLLHSAMFSGLNLALFSLPRLHLEIEAEQGNADAAKVMTLRKDANLLLTTILWGNVAVNTLLTLLMDSVLAGMAAFFVSTFGITFIGEIIPQAYFSRHALRMGARLAPVIGFYRRLLWPVAFPSAKLLDSWLGPDGMHYVHEEHLKAVIEKHMQADEADLDHREGKGALNFWSLDDLPISEEGEQVDLDSVIALPARLDLPIIPDFECRGDDPFVMAVAKSDHKWVILTDQAEVPRLVLDADAFLRAVLSEGAAFDAYKFCHRPILTEDTSLPIGRLLRRLRVEQEHEEDDVIDRDIVLLWGEQRRIVTGADLLGRLLRGIATNDEPAKS
tara:strand:- start:143 stop:1198 length:1056 start_codon:yes stop_codon:yes gene_type:complete